MTVCTTDGKLVSVRSNFMAFHVYIVIHIELRGNETTFCALHPHRILDSCYFVYETRKNNTKKTKYYEKLTILHQK